MSRILHSRVISLCGTSLQSLHMYEYYYASAEELLGINLDQAKRLGGTRKGLAFGPTSTLGLIEVLFESA